MFKPMAIKLRSIAIFCLHRPIIIVGGITLIGAILRLYHLGYKSLWVDEATLYWVSRGSFAEIISQNALNNSGPPLFAFLLNFISKIGDSELILRFIPFAAGTAAIPAIYFLSKQFLSRYAAYFCIFIVAIAKNQVVYSQYMREYSLAFLLATLLLIFFNRFLYMPNRKNCVWLTLICIISVFSQYGLALLILGLNLVFFVNLFFKTDQKNLLIKWIIIQLFVLCAVVVVYNLSLKYQMRAGGFGAYYLGHAYWDGSPRSFFKFAMVNTHSLFTFAYFARGIFFFICYVGFLVALSKPHGRAALMMLAFPVLITFAAACARLYPYYGARQDIFLTPIIYVLAGFGVEFLLKVDRKRISILILTLALGLAGLHYTRVYLKYAGNENIKSVVAVLSDSFESEDRIYIYYGAEPAFKYYYRDNKDRWIDGVRSRGNHEKYFRQLDKILSQQGRIWMVFSHSWNDERQQIMSYVSQFRNINLIAENLGAHLYLVE